MTLYIYIVYYYFILYIKKGRFGESNLKDRFHIKLRVRMDKKQIVKQASQLKSKEDLLNLLNRIKRDEIEEMGFDAFKFHPFTMSKTLTIIVIQIMFFIGIVSFILRKNLVEAE